MKKYSFTFIFLILCTNFAFAKWTYIGASTDSTLFIDFDTKLKNGKFVKMWHMYNFNEPLSTPHLYDSQSFSSTVSRGEYNCTTQESRVLESYDYTDKNGVGRMLGIFKKSDNEWTAYHPNSVGETLWKIACGKYFKK